MKLSHPNIVQLYEVILERNTLHFVFEFLDIFYFDVTEEALSLFDPLARS